MYTVPFVNTLSSSFFSMDREEWGGGREGMDKVVGDGLWAPHHEVSRGMTKSKLVTLGF